MAEHILGPLYYEKMGRTGPVIAFVHPNPMDQSCWIYQMAHLSTWYRCMAIDIPGYGRSPQATDGLTTLDMAQACWEAVDEAYPGEPAILVGCSVGSTIVPHMNYLRPEQTAALVVCGTGYGGNREFAHKRIKEYGRFGTAFRYDHTFQDMSPAFRTTPMAHWFANLFTERNPMADAATIIRQFEALTHATPEEVYDAIKAPMLVLTGSEDSAHPGSFALRDRVAGCELKVLPGAGHACQLEQPWLFDKFMLDFLDRKGLFPGAPKVLEAMTV